MHARLCRQRQAGTRPPNRHIRVMQGQIRASSVHAHRSLAQIPVRHASVDTATPPSAATQGDTPRDREETARIAENSQLVGRFRRWWQVLGSNQRRLSRRFYSPLAPAAQAHAADQQRCAARRGSTPSAPALSRGSGELERATDGHARPQTADKEWPCHRLPLPRPASVRPRPQPASANHRTTSRGRNPIRTIPIGLDLFCDWSRPQGFRYQHGFSTRSGNDGK
jgi:hypothetical protein